MQRKPPWKLRKRCAIKPVTGYGTAQSLHVNPNLVRTPSLEPQANKCTPIHCALQYAVMRHGRFPVRSYTAFDTVGMLVPLSRRLTGR